jgi:hypothetical protein
MVNLNSFVLRANWFLLGACSAFIVMLFIATHADAAELPKAQPTKAVATLCDKETPDGVTLVLFVDLYYADGTKIHYDGTGLYKDAQQVMMAATRAKHFYHREVHCTVGVEA